MVDVCAGGKFKVTGRKIQTFKCERLIFEIPLQVIGLSRSFLHHWTNLYLILLQILPESWSPLDASLIWTAPMKQEAIKNVSQFQGNMKQFMRTQVCMYVCVSVSLILTQIQKYFVYVDDFCEFIWKIPFERVTFPSPILVYEAKTDFVVPIFFYLYSCVCMCVCM